MISRTERFVFAWLPPVVVVALILGVARVASPQAARVTDSAGVRIVANTATSIPTYRLSPQPVLRVGWKTGDYDFVNVVSGTFLSDGSVVTVDRGGTHWIAVLRPDGTVAATLGRTGQGPGEFSSPNSMGRNMTTIGKDTIVVQDYNGRLALFHGADHVRDIAVKGVAGSLRVLGLTAPGKLLMAPPVGVVNGRNFPTPWLSSPMVVLDMATGAADTVGYADSEQSALFKGRSPWKSTGVSTISQGMFVMGRTDSPEVRFIDASGKLRQIVRWTATPVPVSDSMWNSYATGYRDGMTRSGQQPQAINDQLAQTKAQVKDPIPYFSFLVSDPVGNVWVGDYGFSANPPDAISPGFRVMSPRGEWIGVLKLAGTPPPKVLAVDTNRVLVVEKDSLGTNAVAVYRLIRP